MARGHTHVLGLDIGSWAIKAVELQRTGSSIEVIGRPTVVPTPPNSVDAGVIVDPAAVTAALQNLMAVGGFKTKKAIASVGGTSSVVVRITEVPKMSGKELDEAIEWELDRQTPFPIEQTVFDYKPIEAPDADPSAPNMEVLIAVAQEDMINAHVDAIAAAKIVPEAIDVEPLAIARALVDIAGSAFADQTVGVMHMGATSTIIMFVRRGLLSFVRSIPTAGQALTQTIAQNFMGDEALSEAAKKALGDLAEDLVPEGGGYETPQDEVDVLGDEGGDSVFEVSDVIGEPDVGEEPLGPEAEATQLDMAAPDQAEIPDAPAGAVEEPGAADGEPDLAARQAIYEAIATPLVDLAGEIQASLNFYRRQHRNEEVDRMLISGGSAAIPGLADFLAAETGVHTELANPFAELTTDEIEQPGQYLADVGPSMVVAVGLALRDMVE